MSLELKTSSSKSRGPMRKRRMPRAPRWGPSRPLLNEVLVNSRWEYGQLASNSSGVLSAADISPSIATASEYSNFAVLFSECKLVSCRVVFGPSYNTSQTPTLTTAIVGTAMDDNLNSHASTPLTITQVQNLARKKQFTIGQYTASVRQYQMMVPRALEFSLIGSDAPSTPTPWAGSPGCVRIFADHCQTSTNYLIIYVETVHHLRGRH